MGPVHRLPGTVRGHRVRLREGGHERESTSSRLDVTKFGAVGETVEGRFEATMRPGLNEDPQKMEGRFSVCRKSDRRSP